MFMKTTRVPLGCNGSIALIWTLCLADIAVTSATVASMFSARDMGSGPVASRLSLSAPDGEHPRPSYVRQLLEWEDV
jgi:hypothetical protein